MNGSQKIDGVLGNQARLYGMSWKCPRSTESGFHAWSRPRRTWSLEYLPSNAQLLRRCASPRSMLYSVRHMSRSLSQASRWQVFCTRPIRSFRTNDLLKQRTPDGPPTRLWSQANFETSLADENSHRDRWTLVTSPLRLESPGRSKACCLRG